MSRSVLCAAVFLLVSLSAFAQTARQTPLSERATATVTTDAPIYLSVPPGPTPLRTAAVGTVLIVLGQKDDWLNVEFNDPQFGRRSGWVKRNLVSVDDPALKPMNLSVSTAPAKSSPAPSKPAAATDLARIQMSVKIVDRHTQDSSYSYVVPSYLWAQTYVTGNTLTTSATATAPRSIGYSVRGATLALRLPDERIVVVNCDSKYAPKMDYINRRSCRVPLVDDIQVEFNGDNARLIWIVSIDGKKTEDEVYKILAVLK